MRNVWFYTYLKEKKKTTFEGCYEVWGKLKTLHYVVFKKMALVNYPFQLAHHSDFASKAFSILFPELPKFTLYTASAKIYIYINVNEEVISPHPSRILVFSSNSQQSFSIPVPVCF